MLMTVSVEGLLAKMPDTVTDETPRSYWQLLFLYERTTAPGQEEFIFRLPLPFYGRYKNEERAYTFHHALYPIFYSHGTNHWKKWTAGFIFTGDDFYHEDTEKDTDLFLSPLLYWGWGDSEKERYISFFPFYGRIKNKLGWNEINFVLFPLYAGWTYKEYRAHSILWPFVMWGGSETRDDLRIFPFYSRKTHRGKYRKYSIMWPFVQWGHEALDKKEPRGYFLAWPFYMRKWSRDGNLSAHGFLNLILLPPLLAWGSDKKTNSFGLNVLFLYQYETNDSPYTRKHVLFPFYGYYQTANRSTEFFGPFYTRLKSHSVIFESRTHIAGPVLPMYWKTDRYYLKDWKRQSFLKMWPFFQYAKDTKGNMEFRSLVLWPARADKFEKYWGPLVGLVEYREFENGDKYFSTMLRLYSQYWNKREFHLFVAGFEYHSTPEYWSVEFLGGFLGYRRDYAIPAGGDLTGGRSLEARNTLRLLWFDI